MPDQHYLIITLQKPVPDEATGRTLYDVVKTRMADYADVRVSGHVTDHFEE